MEARLDDTDRDRGLHPAGMHQSSTALGAMGVLLLLPWELEAGLGDLVEAVVGLLLEEVVDPWAYVVRWVVLDVLLRRTMLQWVALGI